MFLHSQTTRPYFAKHTHLCEDGVHWYLLLEKTACEIHLGTDVATVDLNFAYVGGLLP